MTNISLSLVAMLYNWQLMRFLGEDGVAAYGVISYVFLIFGAVLIGYSMGSAPLMSYQFGAQNTVEMRSLFTKSLKVMAVANVAMFIAAETCVPALPATFMAAVTCTSDFPAIFMAAETCTPASPAMFMAAVTCTSA